MKTCEQVAQTVLARRDAYLAERTEKIRSAKRYTLAGLMVCAAVFAAAGLFRSGLFRHVPRTVLPNPGAVSETTVPAPGVAAGLADGQTAGEESSTAQPPEAAPGVAGGEEGNTAIDLSPSHSYALATALPGKEADTTAQPSGCEPAATAARPDETANRPSQAALNEPTGREPAIYQNAPTVPMEPGTRQPATELSVPTTRPAPGTPPETTTQADTVSPTTEPVTDAQPETARYDAYVIYNGAVYAAKATTAAPRPDNARTLAQKAAMVVDYSQAEAILAASSDAALLFADEDMAPLLFGDESDALAGADQPDDYEEIDPTDSTTERDVPGVSATRITLLSLPSASAASDRIGLLADGFDGMLILEYAGTEEELFPPEEAP